MHALKSGISGALAPITGAVNFKMPSFPWPFHHNMKKSKSKLVLNSLHIVLEDVPKELICAKCHLVMNIPRQMSGCGKSVCGKSCLGAQLNHCPFCRKASCKPFTNPYYENKISNLMVKCPTIYTDIQKLHNECHCPWSGKVKEVKGHLRHNCEYQMVPCSLCGKEIVKKFLAAHQLDNCPNQKRYCMYCGLQGLAHEIEDHEALHCPRRRVLCPNYCHMFSIEHDKLDSHLDECPMQMVRCSKCAMEFPRNEQEIHEQQQHCKRNSSRTSDSTSLSSNMSLSIDSGLQLTDNPNQVNKKFVIDNYKKYTSINEDSSVGEVFQRVIVSYLSMCTIFLLALLRNQIHVADPEEDHNIPSLLLWSTFMSVSVINFLMGGWTGCRLGSVREWVIVFTIAQLLYLTCFFNSHILPMIIGSLTGSALITLLFIKHRKRYPDSYGHTFYVITHLVESMLVLSVVKYHHVTMAPLAKVISLIVLFDIYMLVLQKKEYIRKMWIEMSNTMKTVCLVILYLLVLLKITSCSLYIISCYFFYGSFTVINVALAATWPFAYIYSLSKEEVQNLLCRIADKVYNLDMYCFWGRVLVTTIFNYVVISHLIIPMIQKTGDYLVGSILVSVLVVYTFLVQIGITSEEGLREILQQPPAVQAETCQIPFVMKLTDKCWLSIAVKIEETTVNRHILAPSNTSPSLNIHVQLESDWHETMKEPTNTIANTQQFSVVLSIVNGDWSSANEVLTISSEMVLTRKKLQECCLTMKNYHNLIQDNSITLQVTATHHNSTVTTV